MSCFQIMSQCDVTFDPIINHRSQQPIFQDPAILMYRYLELCFMDECHASGK